jgi:hypothetical protein
MLYRFLIAGKAAHHKKIVHGEKIRHLVKGGYLALINLQAKRVDVLQRMPNAT